MPEIMILGWNCEHRAVRTWNLIPGKSSCDRHPKMELNVDWSHAAKRIGRHHEVAIP